MKKLPIYLNLLVILSCAKEDLTIIHTNNEMSYN